MTNRFESVEQERDAVKEKVGQEIRRLRQRMGVTQKQMAAQIWDDETMQGHISHWENGRVVPQFASLERIARWAGVPMTVFDIVESSDEPSTADLEEAKDLIRRALQLLEGAQH